MHEDLFIRKSNGLFMKVDTRVILMAEASGGCSKIITHEGVYLVNSTLTQLEEILPSAHFCRVNRSCIAGMAHITRFSVETVFIVDREVPLAKAYREHFFEKVKVVT
ncbi:LytTR family DNA-binding domain-containing protein [Chitinophaga sp.]|uniref:LytR/AlgR family response regulator transcription factor n=1 Tax=Chitinophaga sp. TaxID=1869181 RepID=UPI0031DF6A5F